MAAAVIASIGEANIGEANIGKVQHWRPPG